MLKDFTSLPLSAVLLASAFIAPAWSMDPPDEILPRHIPVAVASDKAEKPQLNPSLSAPLIIKLDNESCVETTWEKELGKSVQAEYRQLCRDAVFDSKMDEMIRKPPSTYLPAYVPVGHK